jgi:hypothetical protein
MGRVATLVLFLVVVLALVAATGEDPTQAATCADYSNQAAAQRARDTRDADGDGIYCESLRCPCSAAKGGVRGTRPLLVHSNGERAIGRADVECRFVESRSKPCSRMRRVGVCGSPEARAQASGIAERVLRWSSGSIRWLGNGTAR